MQANTFSISLTPQQAVPMIYDFIQRGSITGELIDRFVADSPNGGHCVISIYEKHFWRAGNRLTLTVTIDDFYGKTRVHTVGGGGGSGIINLTGALRNRSQTAFRRSLGRILSRE